MYLLQYFDYEHLTSEQQVIAKHFYKIAHQMAKLVPTNPESTVMLRKLLEAKEAALRAISFKA